MNKNLQRIRMALFALLLTIAGMTNAFAQSFTVGKLKYSTIDGKSVSVQGHVDETKANGVLVIPESVEYRGVTYAVTRIRSEAFQHCRGITSVVIPNSVTEIGNLAFGYCSGIISVVIPNSVTTIFFSAFEHCEKLAHISIPKSIKNIAANAFEHTGWFNQQPNGILYLDGCCMGYKGDKPKGKLNIKENTRIIAGGAFSRCKELSGELVLPSSIICIGWGAFEGCDGLTSVIIPNSVTTIYSDAFSSCSNLTSINIPNSVTELHASAFKNNGWSAQQPEGVLCLDGCCLGYQFSYSSDENYPIKNLKIKNNTRLIANGAFEQSGRYENYTFTGELVIPNTVKIIGEKAFVGNGFTSVTIPDSVVSIGLSAFNGCKELTTVIIESPHLRDLPKSSYFYGCNKLLESNIIYK